MNLTDPGTVRAVARRAGLSRKKDFGQHFLIDDGVRTAIVDALNPAAGDTIWEIGPGIGTLTQALASKCARVLAVEIDPQCVAALQITMHGFKNVSVVNEDIMRTTPDSLQLPEPYLAAGNLPYNLTGKILSHLFEAERAPRRAVFLIQREVAHRIAGPPGDWSLATVAIRSVAEVELVADVRPEAFLPPPAVHSSIIRMSPSRPMSERDREEVIKMARSAFQLRRKTLRHGIARALGGDTGRSAEVLARAGIDAGRRPETLDLGEWLLLVETARRME